MGIPDIENVEALFKWIFISLFILLIWLIFYYEIVIVEFTEESRYEGMFFSVLNALIVGMILNVMGFGLSRLLGKASIRYGMVAFVIYMVIQGFGVWGLRFTFQVNHLLPFPLLMNNVYESNSTKAIHFINDNWYWILILIAVSFLLEVEIKL